MKFPKTEYLLKEASKSFTRFPLTIFLSAIGVGFGIFIIENKWNFESPWVLNLLLTLTIGISLSFLITILREIKYKGKKHFWLFQLIGIICSALVYFSFPSNSMDMTGVPYVRFIVLFIITHLIISFIPYLKKGNENGFWHYNRIFFLRFVTSVLYTSFLYIGIILALFAIHNLFNISINNDLYIEILVSMALFNTWFFVSGIPNDIASLDKITSFPKGLKIFLQYVILPLLVIYLVILYAYGAKILIESNWPKGIVSYLISCVAVLGIFMLLLISPYGKLPSNKWMKPLNKWFYILLIPLIFLLFTAIGFRIGDYGFTVRRYYVLLIGIWLSITSLYFIIFKNSSIKFVPISLAVALVLSLVGPCSVFYAGKNNQSRRLKEILTNEMLIKNGKVINEITWNTNKKQPFFLEKSQYKTIDDSIHNEIKSILDYLNDYHDFETVNTFFNQDISTLILKANNDKNLPIQKAKVYMNTLGLEYRKKYTKNNFKYYNYTLGNKEIEISKYNKMIKLNLYASSKAAKLEINKKLLSVSLNQQKANKGTILFSSKSDTSHLDLNPLCKNLKEKYDDNYRNKISLKDLSTDFQMETNNYKLVIYYISFSLNKENDSVNISSLDGLLFFK